MHVKLLVEEPSAEVFANGFMAKLLPAGATWDAVVFQGKADLLKNLEQRLKGFRAWIPEDWRIVVLVDKDRQDCRTLKAKLEAAAAAAGFPTKSHSAANRFVVLNRIAVEELEAWFFGDVAALVQAFPGVSPHLASRAPYRNSDAIAGGTWEALERVLQSAGYYAGGLPKIELAREMAAHMEPARNRSQSFQQFVTGLAAL